MSNTSAQPSLDQAYETSGNPTDKEPVEQSRARQNAHTNEENAVAHRSAHESGGASLDDAVPTSTARGVRGAGAGEEQRGWTQAGLDAQELDAEQMGAPGEGRVASAVERSSGAEGGQPGLETDLDRKKAEQAPARAAVQAEEQRDLDVAGVLGQRGGGPANPVDRNGYPNSGDS